MYNMYQNYPYPYYVNTPAYPSDYMCNTCKMHPTPYNVNMQPMYPTNLANQLYNSNNTYMDQTVYDSNFTQSVKEESILLKDYGPEPFVVNIEKATKQNNTFRTALWTGNHLQLTLMSINVGEDIGLEVHPNLDQFLRIEEGQGLVQMGDRKDRLDFQEKVYDNYAFIIPAGKWHNLINTGYKPIKLYSIYAPPQHPKGTVHETKAIAAAAEHGH